MLYMLKPQLGVTFRRSQIQTRESNESSHPTIRKVICVF